MSSIRTPDQRVRVFVSSTLQELAPERIAAKRAIAELHLIPVLFEMGARPHPPRDLYRAYLEQSHVFVGIYGSSYGWVAPGMELSGLEDEYVLSEGKPRLVYVRHPAPDRHERLTTLLRRVQSAENTCYQRFSTPEELHQLLANDLALLLSERFEGALSASATAPVEAQSAVSVQPKPRPLPAPRTALIGREELLARVGRMLAQPGLVTLIGAGGTGKTALALQLAHDGQAQLADGACFVPLSSVDDPALLAPAIEQALGMRDAGQALPWEVLASYLAEKRCLLVLDNYEQLASEAARLSELLARCPRLTLLVTSRTPLHVRGERVVAVDPLPVIAEARDSEQAPAVQLFVQRAEEACPTLLLDASARAAIAEICRRLDGLPLAIELAAAHVRLLPPTALLQRMAKVLDLLELGARDLPERQRTLRATLDWSYRLLDEPCQRLFRRLSVFEGGFTLTHAEALHGRGSAFLSLAERLLDMGLVRREPSGADGEPRLSLLQTVREYGLEQLEQQGELREAQELHAELFASLASHLVGAHGQGEEREAWLEQLERELPNLREAFHYLLPRRERALELFGNLARFWGLRGHLSEGKSWVAAAGIAYPPLQASDAQLPARVRAAVYQSSGVVKLMAGEYRTARVELEESARVYQELGDAVGKARTLVGLGVAAISVGDERGAASLVEAMQLSEQGDSATFIAAATFVAEGLAMRGDLEAAGRCLDRATVEGQRSRELGLLGVVALQRGNMAATVGELARAEAYYQEALVTLPEKIFATYPGWTAVGLAYCCLCSGRIDEARANLHAALGHGRRIGDLAVTMGALLGFAVVSFQTGHERAGATLLGGAEGILARTGFVPWSATRKLQQDAEALMHTHPELEPERMRGRELPLPALLALLQPLDASA